MRLQQWFHFGGYNSDFCYILIEETKILNVSAEWKTRSLLKCGQKNLYLLRVCDRGNILLSSVGLMDDSGHIQMYVS